MPSIFDRVAVPNPAEKISKPQRRRAAALQIARHLTTDAEEMVALAEYMLEGSAEYNSHQIIRDARLVAYRTATDDG